MNKFPVCRKLSISFSNLLSLQLSNLGGLVSHLILFIACLVFFFSYNIYTRQKKKKKKKKKKSATGIVILMLYLFKNELKFGNLKQNE